MNTLPGGNGGPSLTRDPCQYSISDTRTDNNTSNSVQGHSNQNIGNVVNSNNNIINVGVSEESSRIQAWLSPLEPHARHQDVRNRRLDGVGDWVLKKDEFESWQKSQDSAANRTLVCYGDQGAGKTYISSLVIDTLSEQAYGKNIAVLSLYCDYQAQKDQSAVNMLGSLLGQIALGALGIETKIQDAYKKSRQGGGKGLRLSEMVELFVQTIGPLERAYICVDAMDELVPQHRSEFLRALKQIMQEAPNIRLFLTGRPHVRGELDKHLTKGACAIQIVPDQGDIAKYISRKMDDDDDRDPDLMTESLKNDITKTILEKASDMFLLVALNIEAILGETSLGRRKEMLLQIATTGVDLHNVYDQTLRRIKDQKGDRSRLGMEVLMWVSHAERPLRIDELCHALAAEMGATDLNVENIRPRDTVLRSCLGLAVVDAETSTVRLIHYTLQEYLSRPSILPDAHRTLGQTCLIYLNYNQVNRLPADKHNIPNLPDMPFLEYSSLYWGSHAKKELSDHAKSLALKLLNQYDSHISSALLFNTIPDLYLYPHSRHSFPGLHCACYLGIDKIVATLIEIGGCDINQGDSGGFTPLTWAAHEGNVGAMMLLLAQDDIDPDKPDICNRSPLSWASRNGHEGVVRLLLTRDDVNPDKPDNYGKTPLWQASCYGHQGVVKLLLARDDVNPDKPDNDGETPLWWASFNGHERVVRLLLARDDVNPDKPNNYGQTPLWAASFSGHEGVVRLLLARDDVNPDKPDNNGITPLWFASYNGHEGVVRLLLARGDVNPDKPNNDGETPLWFASYNGHEGVVRLLLARDDVNPNKPNNSGQTPLQCASRWHRKGVVSLLLSHGAINPDQPDKNDPIPLPPASSDSSAEVTEPPVAQGDVTPDEPDNDDLTPIASDSSDSSEEAASPLVASDDPSPDEPENSDQTPTRISSTRRYRRIITEHIPRLFGKKKKGK